MTGSPEMFFVMNADVCGDFPLLDMLKFHRERAPDAYGTILGTEVTGSYTQMHQFDDSASGTRCMKGLRKLWLFYP